MHKTERRASLRCRQRQYILLAIAAAAVSLGPSARTANAQDTVTWQINPSLSSLEIFKYYRQISPGFATPQGDTGNITSVFGLIQTQFTGNTLQLLPGSSISAAINPNGPFAPGLDNDGSVDINAAPLPGNFGLANSQFSLSDRVSGLTLDVLPHGNPPMQLVPNGTAFQFSERAQSFVGTGGADDIVWNANVTHDNGTGITHTTFAGEQLPLAHLPAGLPGTVNAIFFAHDGPGTYDPVNRTLSVTVDFVFSDTGGPQADVLLFGTLVATPFVPEPSTLALAALGFAALAAYRLRRRLAH
jgi:hypothetical protein